MAKSPPKALWRRACNAEFLRDPMSHVAFYPDHGIAHVRDAVKQIVLVIDTIHGVLIPFRPPVRLDFLRGYGVLLAYLHCSSCRSWTGSFSTSIGAKVLLRATDIASSSRRSNCGSGRAYGSCRSAATEASPRRLEWR